MTTAWLLEGYDDPFCAPCVLGAYSTLEALREHAPDGEWEENTAILPGQHPSQYTIMAVEKIGAREHKRRYEVREVELDKAPEP